MAQKWLLLLLRSPVKKQKLKAAKANFQQV
jgi:hypothetical protein